MNKHTRLELADLIAHGKTSSDAQYALVWGEVEAVLEWEGNDAATSGDVQRAIIAMDNVIVSARSARTQLRRML